MARPVGVPPPVTAAPQAQRPRTSRRRINRPPAHRFNRPPAHRFNRPPAHRFTTRPPPDTPPTIRPPHAAALRTRPAPGVALPDGPIRIRRPQASGPLVAPPLAGPLG